MRAAKRFRGGEAAESTKGRKPARRFRPPKGVTLRERNLRRNALIAMHAGRLPFVPADADDLADAFGLTRRQVDRILAGFRGGA